MPDRFDAAALRHFRDGGALLAKGAPENADQLFGFAAECAIKSALVTLPGCCEGPDLSQSFWQHVDQLWDKARLQSLHRRYPKLLRLLQGPRPFDDWSARQRYGPDGSISSESVERHRKAASRLLGSVGLAGQRAR